MQNFPSHKEEFDKARFLIAEGPVYKEKKNGFWIEYYPQNNMSQQLRVKARGFYKNGEKIGRWFEYHYSGALKGYGEYLHNEKINRWFYFNNNGILISSFLYPIRPIKLQKQTPKTVAKRSSSFFDLLKNIFSRQNQ